MTGIYPDLIALFDKLPFPASSPTNGILFSVLQLEDYRHLHLGKDQTGKPALLISTKESAQKESPAPVILEHLVVQHDVECRLVRAEGPSTQRFSVIRCISSERLLQEYFLRVLSPVAIALPESPAQQDVVRTIDALVELFRALSRPSRKPLQGLWAELCIIMQSSDPRILIVAWHNEPEERYDFAYKSQRIEVKSTSTRVRAHHFSLEQLRPPAGVEVLVASVFVELSVAGLTIYELVSEIRIKVQDIDLIAVLDRKVAEVLGSEWREAASLRCDVALALESLRYFEASAIPTLIEAPPPSVSEVRFKSDLTGISPIDTSLMSSRGKLLAAAAVGLA